MRSSLLTISVVGAAALLQACTGGQIADVNGDPLPGIATNYTQYKVTFQDLSAGGSGATSTGVASNGDFGFDPYAPGSASNNATYLPTGSYEVSVSVNGYEFSSPYDIDQVFNTQGCKDTYTGQEDKACAIYQFRLLTPGPVAATPQAPVVNAAYTIVELAGPPCGGVGQVVCPALAGLSNGCEAGLQASGGNCWDCNVGAACEGACTACNDGSCQCGGTITSCANPAAPVCTAAANQCGSHGGAASGLGCQQD